MDIAPISRTPPAPKAEPAKLEQVATSSSPARAETLATKDLFQFQRAEAPGQTEKQGKSPGATASKDAAQATKEAVDALNQKALAQQRSLRFKVHDGTGQTVVSLVDAESDEVIRQIPTEEALHLAEVLAEQNKGQEAIEAGAMFATEL